MSSGIVVDHKESGVRYAISEAHLNPEVHEKVRDLKPGETVQGYQPRSKDALSALVGTQPTLDIPYEQGDDSGDSQRDSLAKAVHPSNHKNQK